MALLQYCRYIVLLTLFSPLLSFSQGTLVEGLIYEKGENQPIPYANVSISKKMEGTYSDLNGHFSLYCSPGDTIQISFVGYKTIILPVFDLSDTIYLVPSPITLEQVEIVSKKSSKKGVTLDLGFYKERKDGLYTGFRQAALKINNETGREGIINYINYKIGHLSDFPHNKYQVRVRILTVTDQNSPGEDLLTKEKILTIGKRQRKLKVDLSDASVVFPTEGCFIVLEFLGHINEKGKFIPYNDTYRENSYHFAPVFSASHQKQMSWIGSGTNWKQTSMRLPSGFANFNFGIEVKTFE